MKIAILQEARRDDADYAEFHGWLVKSLREKYEADIFEPAQNGWQEMDYLGAVCRAFSLAKHWGEVTSHSVIYGSPMTILPFINAAVTPIVAFHRVTAALQRSLYRPDYGEDATTFRRHLEEARLAGVILQENTEDQYRLMKEAEMAAAQTNYPIVASSRSVKEDLLTFYSVPPNRVMIIPYGVHQIWFNKAEGCAQCDNRFADLDNKEPFLIYYADLKQGLTDFISQGVDRIMETFQRIRELQKLVILSTNDSAYKKLFEKQGAIIVENPTPEHLIHLFGHGGMYVQTARYESRTLPIIQAMASSLPIVSYPVGLAQDIVETGKNGFLVQNLIQLIAKVDFLRNNIAKAEEFGKNSYKVARAKFVLEKSVDGYEKYFTEIEKSL